MEVWLEWGGEGAHAFVLAQASCWYLSCHAVLLPRVCIPFVEKNMKKSLSASSCILVVLQSRVR